MPHVDDILPHVWFKDISEESKYAAGVTRSFGDGEQRVGGRKRKRSMETNYNAAHMNAEGLAAASFASRHCSWGL